MYITGVGTAVPQTRYTQRECWDALRHAPQFPHLSAPGRVLLERVLLGDNGIHTRHLALEKLEDSYEIDPDVLARRFLTHAPVLAERAARAAMAQAGVGPRDIDAIVISTCTGYLCPGLTSYVGEALELRTDALGLDLVGQGCGAALPNMRAAEGLVTSGCAHVLSVCVEVCSAAFYLDNDPGVLVSACLFADGAGAAVCSRQPSARTRRIEWKRFCTELNPVSRDLLRFEQRNGMLRNILAPEVPGLAAQAARRVLEKGLDGSTELREQITTWIWHAGGRDVLLALLDKVELTEQDLCWSALTLRDVGNI